MGIFHLFKFDYNFNHIYIIYWFMNCAGSITYWEQLYWEYVNKIKDIN